MSPLEAILQWLRSIDEAERHEIAFMLSFLLFDDLPSTEEGAAYRRLEQWLEVPVPLKPRRVGKALSFRACFEHLFAKRFGADSWEETHSFMRRIIKDGMSDPESEAGQVAGGAFKMLRELPDHEAKWKAMAGPWHQLVADYLTDSALERWQFDL